MIASCCAGVAFSGRVSKCIGAARLRSRLEHITEHTNGSASEVPADGSWRYPGCGGTRGSPSHFKTLLFFTSRGPVPDNIECGTNTRKSTRPSASMVLLIVKDRISGCGRSAWIPQLLNKRSKPIFPPREAISMAMRTHRDPRCTWIVFGRGVMYIHRLQAVT